MGKRKHTGFPTSRKDAAVRSPGDAPRERVAMGIQAQMQVISGPMPSADELAKYEQVLAGSAERFLQCYERQIILSEAQMHHRIRLESTVVGGDNKRSWTGLFIGAVVCIGGLLWSYSLAMNGHGTLAGIGVVTDLGGMAGAFVYGTRSRRRERKDRIQALSKDELEHR